MRGQELLLAFSPELPSLKAVRQHSKKGPGNLKTKLGTAILKCSGLPGESGIYCQEHHPHAHVVCFGCWRKPRVPTPSQYPTSGTFSFPCSGVPSLCFFWQKYEPVPKELGQHHYKEDNIMPAFICLTSGCMSN